MTVFGGALFLAKGTIRASVHLFESTLQRVLRNPMSFFDQTPTGRILNRLSKDTDVIDNTLPSILRSWITCLFGFISTYAVAIFKNKNSNLIHI
ncbi:canalicular multispecific organic anion transporter 1-like [Apis florea]|uniref:canalicular multispecific organic anion transporter 1-like n=1 Tax=Apis florea TaxID=7463 RepID=UPI00062933A1|nr:canalicular multispecific organic anion transporter 1-like [Apis florea]